MDTITQGLLGAVTAHLGFRTKLGRSAGWIGAAAGILPDLDVFARPIVRLFGGEFGAFDFLRYHRGASHGIAMIFAEAALVAGVCYAFRRKQFGLLYLCALVAGLSHPLLDVCTVYGTQLLAPFSDRRFAINAVPIVDLIYTGTLIATLLGVALARRVRPKAALITAWVGFSLSVGYLAAGRGLHNNAVNRALTADVASSALGPVEVEAYPGLGSIFVWRVVLHNGNDWFVGRTHSLFPKPVEFRRLSDADDPLVQIARQHQDIRTFDWFAAGQLRTAVGLVEGRRVVDFYDMRYGFPADSTESLWLARAVFDSDGRVHSVHHLQRQNREDVSTTGFIKSAWREMFRP